MLFPLPRRRFVSGSSRPGVSRGRVPALLLAVLLTAPAAPLRGQDAGPATNPDAASYVVPPAQVRAILEADKNYASLEYASPGRRYVLVPHVNELSTLELMSRETYRLAELELRPRTNRHWYHDTWGVDGIRIYDLEDRRFRDVELPEGSFASDFTWSPDGTRIAFLAHLPERTEVWVAEAGTGRARSLSDAPVLATLASGPAGSASGPSSAIQWTPEGTVLALLVPRGRGTEPVRDRVPDAPVVRRTRTEPTRSPTYPNLLEDAHDEDLFEYHTTSRLAELGEGGPRFLGEPRMYESISLAPDGRHLIVTFIERPFSFITSYRGFPRRTAVLDRNGRIVSTLEALPLREGRSRGGDGEAGPRDFAWRPDGAGISYLARAVRPERDEGRDVRRPDRVYLLEEPFAPGTGRIVAESEDPLSDAWFSRDGRHLFAAARRGDERALAYWAPDRPPSDRRLLVDFHRTDAATDLPGSLVTERTSNGHMYAALSADGDAAFLEGPGYAADLRPTPFIDRLRLADGSVTRVFEGSKDRWERPLIALNEDRSRLVVGRESVTEFPDSYLWEDGTWGANLTNNVDPFPDITAARRIDFSFERRDGLEVRGRVSMPVGWREGDPPVPAIFWTYPREYEAPGEYEEAAIRARNRNAFIHMSWLRWSDIWLAAGYALVHPDIPIVGENYNDTYIASLVDAMYGAIRAVDGLGVVDVDRIGHGGHSYGAFATANILANAPFFKAGIAGDGAYNRSLTPDGFQAERRNIWEAPGTYIEMSPFFRADQIQTPLLLYHGGDDNNTGTFPVQSRRLISALTILGKEAVLYEYPYESHTPRAIENKLDMWARFVSWFDEHVKGAEPNGTTDGAPRR